MPPDLEVKAEVDSTLSLEEAQIVANAMMLVQEAGARDRIIEEHGKVQTAISAVLECTGFAKALIRTQQLVQKHGGTEADVLGEIRASVEDHGTDKLPDREGTGNIPRLETGKPDNETGREKK